EWARHHGVHRLGVFPGRAGDTEGCTVADMVALAVGLTDAGVGDYWEDVDQYVRNGLLAVQATDLDEMTRVSEARRDRPPNSPTPNGVGTATSVSPASAWCCLVRRPPTACWRGRSAPSATSTEPALSSRD